MGELATRRERQALLARQRHIVDRSGQGEPGARSSDQELPPAKSVSLAQDGAAYPMGRPFG